VPNFRKLVRDAYLGFLADAAAGFNAQLIALAVPYQIAPFQIFWQNPSTNFSQTWVEDVELGPFEEFPAVALYTSEANDTGVPRALSFTGDVTACLDFWIRYRTGAETYDSESLLDATEDAALTVLNNPLNAWPPGVLFSRETEIKREPLLPLADGFQQKTSLMSRFSVRIT
jgi:hypothetical protein